MRFLETVLVTMGGGALFTLLHIPLPWMLGPLSAAIIWSTAVKRKLTWSIGLRNAGLAVLGYMMGITFTRDTGQAIILQLPTMLIATVLMIGFSLAAAYWTSRQAGITLSSGVIGSIPGGLSQMVVLSEEVEGADQTVVAFMQTIRLLAVIFIVPYIAFHGIAGQAAGSVAKQTVGFAEWTASPILTLGIALLTCTSCWIASKLKFPTPCFLGPVVFGAILAVAGFHAPQVPTLVITAAQWMIGTQMGIGIKLSSLSNWRKLVPYTLLGAVGVVLFSLVLALLLSSAHPISFLTAFLSMAPGGMTEMGVTASLLHADITMVVAYQMFRILFILFVVPPLLRWGLRKLARSGSRSG